MPIEFNAELLIPFAIFAFFYISIPGPAVLLAIVNSIRAGMKTVVMSSLGNILGLALMSLASMLGLGLLMQTSAILFMVVKLIGAVYFIYLGIKFLFNHSTLAIHDVQPTLDSNTRSAKSYFSEAFLVAATNPKAILFFTAIFPQFLDTNHDTVPQMLVMTVMFLIISFSLLCTYGYLASHSKRWLENKNRMLWFHRITGGFFISLGVGLLQLKRAQ